MSYAEDPRVVLTLDAGGTKFAFSAVRSMHDLIVVCEPSLARAADTSAGQFDRLSAELARVQAGVQNSVRSTAGALKVTADGK